MSLDTFRSTITGKIFSHLLISHIGDSNLAKLSIMCSPTLRHFTWSLKRFKTSPTTGPYNRLPDPSHPRHQDTNCMKNIPCFCHLHEQTLSKTVQQSEKKLSTANPSFPTSHDYWFARKTREEFMPQKHVQQHMSPVGYNRLRDVRDDFIECFLVWSRRLHSHTSEIIWSHCHQLTQTSVKRRRFMPNPRTWKHCNTWFWLIPVYENSWHNATFHDAVCSEWSSTSHSHIINSSIAHCSTTRSPGHAAVAT